MQTHRYKELDALRGLAALMVLFFHFTWDRPQSDLGFNLGTTGVELFFMISGFVIFMSLLHVKKGIHFVISRVTRLYPTYWACVTFTFIIFYFYRGIALTKTDLLNYWGNMSMFQFYMSIPDLDDSYWTMIIEMLFYIGILLLFQFRKLNHVTAIGMSLVIVVTLIGSFFYEHAFVKDLLKWVPLLQYISLFVAGIIFYKLYHDKSKQLLHYTLLAVCLLSQILYYNYSDRFGTSVTHKEYSVMLIVYFTLFTLFVNGKLGFIVSKPSLFFGKISFAMYLIHQSFSRGILLPYFINDLHMNFWLAALVFTLPIIVFVASLITYGIEIPLRRKIKKLLSAPTMPDPVSAVGDNVE